MLPTAERKAQSLLIITIISIFILCIFNFFTFNTDDLAIKYSISPAISLFDTNFQNYRYVMAFLSYCIYKLDISYYSNFFAISLLYAASISYCCLEFSRYVKLPAILSWALIATTALHGFMADIYAFTMAYWNYAVGWLSIGAALYALRTWRSSTAIPFATLMSTICLMSYQTMLQVLLLAGAMALIRDYFFAHPDEHRKLKDILKPAICYVLACAIFLTTKHYLGPESGRPVSLEAAFGNIDEFLLNIPLQFLDGNIRYKIIFPLHERFFYAFSFFASIIILLSRYKNLGFRKTTIAIFALMSSLAISANPFNLPSIVFWPSPRSLTAAAFLHSCLFLMCFCFVCKRFCVNNNIQVTILAIFTLFSYNNQFSLIAERQHQNEKDLAVATKIVNQLSQKAPLTPNTEVAVVSSWENAAQLHRIVFMDYGLSAFSTSWSPVPLLRAVSGVQLKETKVQREVCPPLEVEWRIIEVGKVFVVCMR